MKFYLIRPNEDQSSVYADINFKTIRHRVATGIIVITKHWNLKDEKLSSKHPEYSLINARLNLLRGNIDSYLSDLKIRKASVTSDSLKSAFLNIIENRPHDYVETVEEKMVEIEIKPKFLLEIFDNWIKDRIKTKRFREGTMKRYRVTYNHLIGFSTKTRKKYTLEDLDIKFFDNFIKYLQIDMDLVDNSIGAVTKLLKTLLKDLDESGDFNIKKDYRKLKVFRDNAPPTISIDDSEIKSIADLVIQDKKLSEIRDLFIFQIHSLQRESDLFQIREEHIDLKNMELNIVQVKTNAKVTIPIDNIMLEILEKYNYILPKVRKNQYSSSLKRIFEMAGINDTIEISRQQGNGQKRKVFKKYQLASSHIARRAGITSLLRKGVIAEDIMKVSGHEDRDSMDKYVKITQKDAISAVRKAWNS